MLLRAGYRMNEPVATNVFVRMSRRRPNHVVKQDLFTGEQRPQLLKVPSEHHGMM
jgi:hypothetical protein